MPKFVAIIFLLFISSHLQAQTWEVGGAIGGAGYQGDLNLNNPIKLTGLEGGLFVKRNFNGYLAAKLSYTMGRISADDSKSNSQQFRDRNLSFSDKLNEISLIGEFNFMKYIPDAGPNKYTPYIYTGIGLTSYNPRTNYQGSSYSLRELRTEGQPEPYGKRTMVVPYGAGIKYNFNSKWTVAGDVGYRFTFTDYLDDVSTVYPVDPSKLPSNVARALSDRSGEVGKPLINSPGSQRGDFKKRDTYFFIGFTISYTFVTQSCYY
jgi:opacity protein-like surface antigen